MNREKQQIFIVDDEVAAREMVGDYLRMHGFAVTLCGGGTALRSAIQQQSPDLVILDLNMPEEDGLSIVRFLKQECPVPVIMLTATASAIDRVVGLELGADDYLAKPCELRELLARIRSVLRRTRWSQVRQPERRLAAIVSFDFVGFSRFVQDDEPSTLAALDAIFSEVITPSLVRFRGTLFKMLGDGGLIEFQSVVDAVDWSIFFQNELCGNPLAQMPGGQIEFRVGVAVGDVVINQSDRLGEGVTLAARIQEVALPGSVTVSDYVHQFVRGKINARFEDCGTKILKNIALPMRVWKFVSTED
jgi:CheY-like chemotaxis protein